MNQRKKELKRKEIIFSIIIIFVLLVLGLYLSVKKIQSVNKEKEELTKSNETLQSTIDQMVYDSEDHSYDYLAIGNSITKHPVVEYWWGDWGMAATSADKDFFHLVGASLTSSKAEETVNTQVLNFTIWEDPFYNRGETLQYMDGYLSDSLDLVTIQLGENVTTQKSSLESDYEELIHYIQEKCPKAQILMIGEFWADEEKDEAKRQACTNCGVTFIDLSPIQGDEYRSTEGTVVTDATGAEHTIDRQDVAAHPNDEAMQYIAEQILANVQ